MRYQEGKVNWSRLEGVTGHTEVAVVVDQLPNGTIGYMASEWTPSVPSTLLTDPPTRPAEPCPPQTASISKTVREVADEMIQVTLPYLALGGFAGLRTAEIKRLAWQDIDLEERVITVGAAKAKTASRRTVPISDNLAAWLKPLCRESGPVLQLKSEWNWLPKLSKCIEGGWRRNALRHSYISYRLALVQDIAKVAFEAGNSPQMVHSNYKALMTERATKAWFEIAPR